MKNYPIKTVGEDAFYSNYIGPIITLFQNLNKSQKKFKNSPTVKISKGQVSDIIFDACMKFQNYPIKTVGTVGQNKHRPGEWYHIWCLYEISKLSD